MKSKNCRQKIKYVISGFLFVSLLAGIVAGCSFPYDSYLQGSSASNAVTKDVVQANVDSLLDSIAQTGGDVEEEELLGETFLVKNKIALGDILSYKLNRYNIVEITPNSHCPITGYMIGGQEPLDCFAQDAALNKEVGIMIKPDGSVEKYTTDKGVQFPDTDASVNSNQKIFGDGGSSSKFIYNVVRCSGYMQKVSSSGNEEYGTYRAEGGTYAFKENTKNEMAFVSEYSKYDVNYPNTFESDDFCWIWHELDEDSFYKNFKNDFGIDFPSDDNYNIFIDKEENSNVVNKVFIPDWVIEKGRVYLHNVEKRAIRNNELFLLQSCGIYETNSETLGLYSYSNNQIIIDQDKLNCLDEFYGDGQYSSNLTNHTLYKLHSVEKPNIVVSSAKPNDDNLVDLIKNADLVFFHLREGGLYESAQKLFQVEHPECNSFYATMPEGMDISEACLEMIRTKVNDKTLTLAMDIDCRDKYVGTRINTLAVEMFGTSGSGEGFNQAKQIENRVLFDDNTQILSFGSDGMSALENAIKSTTHKQNPGDATKIGDITIVGAGYSGTANNIIRNPAFNPESSDDEYDPDNPPEYQIQVSSFQIDDSTQTPEKKRAIKVIYLNEMQFEEAKKNGIDIFCLINIKKNYTLFLDGDYNGSVEATNSKIESLVVADNKIHAGYPDTNKIEKIGDNVTIHYDSCKEFKYVDGDYKYGEFKFHIPDEYFKNLDVPVQFNLKNGIGENAGKFDIEGDLGDGAIRVRTVVMAPQSPSGDDVLLFVVRDTFDLD